MSYQTGSSRRDFLRFVGRGAAWAALGGTVGLGEGCKKTGTQGQTSRALDASGQIGAKATKHSLGKGKSLPFAPLAPSFQDDLVLAEGFRSQVVLSWGDRINVKGETFGYNNDFTAYLPIQGAEEGLLWVNHESPHRLFVAKKKPGEALRKEHVEREREAVGGSLVKIRRNAKTQRWEVDLTDKRNRRFSAVTPMEMDASRPIAGKKIAQGTLGNCCGGVTPWGHVLTCEENYDEFYGEVKFENGKRQLYQEHEYHGWSRFFPEPPEHYGWVVEINPQTGTAKKRTGLGRFAHEGAATVQAEDGRCVVYMGDDSNNQHIYKFVSQSGTSLEKGELFAADLEKGRWLSLDWRKQPLLRKHFRDQTDVLIRTREAARLLGATPMDRPEGVQVDPVTKAVYVCLTKNSSKQNWFGSILKLEEKGADFRATHFLASTFLPGGEKTGFACPDNIAFDPAGNLWMTNDIASKAIGRGRYKAFGHNSLHCIPLRGAWAGQVIRVASAPKDAELTGMSFSPDGKTLFLSVQHPGSCSEHMEQLTSHWPLGGKAIPKPSVVAISGPSLEVLTSQSR